MVIIVVFIAGFLSFNFLKPWIAVPITILSLVIIRSIQFRIFNKAAEDEMRMLRQNSKYLPWEQRIRINSLPRSSRFFTSVILICMSYFIPGLAHLPPKTVLLFSLPTLLLGGAGFFYHGVAVGMSPVLRFIVPFLCIVIPAVGVLLGFSPFGLR